MKKYKFLGLMTVVAALLFVGCEKKTKGLSRETFYAQLEVVGDEVVTLPLGGTYEEKGIKAIENGVDISDKVVISGSVDANSIGIYTVTYSVKNLDDFESEVSRTVLVYDATCPIESGVYNASVYRTSDNEEHSGYKLAVLGTSSTTVQIEDALGGFYYLGRNYGPGYAAKTEYTITGGVTLNSSSGGAVTAWGDAIDSSTGTYDAASETIKLETGYAGMTMKTTLTK